LNATLTVQLAPAAKLAPQVLLGIAKSSLARIEVKFTGAALMLVT